eukprot:366067-Chlamydomonas_euryale.AAC.6
MVTLQDLACLRRGTGRYKLSVQLNIERSGVVLRGAGSNQTTLFFSKSLTDLYGQTWHGEYSGGAAHSDWKVGAA